MFNRILLPIDGSDLSNAAVRQACAFARAIDARLIFYYARPGYLPNYFASDFIVDIAGTEADFIQAMEKQASEILHLAVQAAETAGVEHTELSDECNAPYEGIIAAAKSQNCDLIFMASHGRRGIGALLLGSETQKVLTHCRIPVLVYR